MDQPILLEKQRQILGTLRDKTAEVVQAELAEVQLAEGSEGKIRGSASAQKEQAQSQLREAREALSRGRMAVQQTLPHATGMLELVSTHSLPNGDTAEELGRAAASARQAVRNLEKACENLQVWRSDKARQDLANQKIDEIAREKKRKRRQKIVLSAAALLIVAGALLVLWSRQSTLNNQYDAGLAMLEAKQWQEARGIFADLGNHRDSPTMVAEAFYLEAADALQSGELETAREVLERIPGYRDSYVLLTEIAPTSTDIPTFTPEVTKETPPKASPTVEDSPTPKPPSETPTEEPSETPIPVPTKCGLSVDSELSSAWTRDRLGCPTSGVSVTWAAWEPFERGRMLWRSDNMEVYVLHFKNGSEQTTGDWQLIQDEWDGSNPNGIGLSPPAGLREPVRGFGWVWRTLLGGPNSAIGWARQEERGICIRVQSFEKGFIFRSSQAQCYHEYNRASELPLLLFALQGGKQGTWWRFGQ